MAHASRSQQSPTAQQLLRELERRCRGDAGDSAGNSFQDVSVWRAALLYAVAKLQQYSDVSHTTRGTADLAALLDHAGVSLDAFLHGLPAAAAQIEPQMRAMAQPTSASESAAAQLDVLPLQQAYVHATVLGRKLKAVLSPILSSNLSSETVQTVSHASWALFLAAKAEQAADRQANGLADQLCTLLGAVAAVCEQLPPHWLATGSCTAAALAAANGTAAATVSAAAARASRLLKQAQAAAGAGPQPGRGSSRAAAAGPMQVSHPGALSAQPEAAAQHMVAAAVWLEARYAERCCGGGGGCDLPCIDERGFAGWCPWQPAPVAVDGTAPAAAAAVPAAPASAVTSWPAGAYALEAAGGAAVPSSAADGSASTAAHPAAQQQQQPLEAAPEDAAEWLRHVVDATAQQGPPHDHLEAWTPGQSAAALERARSGAEAVFCPTPEQSADPAELQAASERCDEAQQLYLRLLAGLAGREGAEQLPPAGDAFQTALLAVACQLVAAAHGVRLSASPRRGSRHDQQESGGESTLADVLRILEADAFEAGRLAAPLLAAAGPALRAGLRGHLATLEQRVLEELAWRPGSSLYARLAEALGCTNLAFDPPSGCSDDENARSHSPPRGSRAPLEPISRPDGGSPATPRKRGRGGQFVGPVPIHMPPANAADAERSSEPLTRIDGLPDSPPREAMLPTLVVASPMSPGRRRSADRDAITILNSPPGQPHPHPPPPPPPPLAPWACPGAMSDRIRVVGSGPFARAEDPENVLPLPPAFGDPAGDAPLLPANAPGNPVSLPSRGLMAAFLAKMLHLGAARMAWLVVRLPLQDTRAEFYTQAFAVLRFLAYERTGLLFGRHLDQMVLAAVYATAKVRGLHQISFKETLDQYRKMPQARSHIYRRVPLLQDAVLRPLSTGDIIGFYNTIIIPAAKDYLHAMVDGKTPLHPPPVPLPPLPADDAAEDGVQATDSAALTASGATGSGLGTDAGLMSPRTRSLHAASSPPPASAGGAVAAGASGASAGTTVGVGGGPDSAPDLAADSGGGVTTGSPARIPHPPRQAQGRQPPQGGPAATRASPRRGRSAATAAADRLRRQPQQPGAGAPGQVNMLPSVSRAASMPRAVSLAHGMGGDMSDFGAAVTAAVASEAAAEAPAGSPSAPTMQQTVGVEALEREAAAELEALNAPPQGSHMAEGPPSSPRRLAPEHARAHVAASPTRARGCAPPRGAATAAGGAVPASVRAAQRLAAAAGANAAAAATAATARAQRHSRVVRSDPGGQPPAGTAHSPALRATEHRVPHPRPSAPGSPAARSVRRRLGV